MPVSILHVKWKNEFVWGIRAIAKAGGLSPDELQTLIRNDVIRISRYNDGHRRYYMSKLVVGRLKLIHTRYILSKKAKPRMLKPRPPKQHKIWIQGEQYVVTKCSGQKKD